jgi:Rrf2 family protein
MKRNSENVEGGDLSVGGSEGHRSGSLYGISVEYGLHCLLWLMEDKRRASSRDLAEIQGVSVAMMAKIMPRLERGGIVSSRDGIKGGYELAKPPTTISILDVVDAIEGKRKIFDCKDVRRGCVLFVGEPPSWAVSGVCRIHAVMLRAEEAMRSSLSTTTLADLAQGEGRPREFEDMVATWFGDRKTAREDARVAAVRESSRGGSTAKKPL